MKQPTPKNTATLYAPASTVRCGTPLGNPGEHSLTSSNRHQIPKVYPRIFVSPQNKQSSRNKVSLFDLSACRDGKTLLREHQSGKIVCKLDTDKKPLVQCLLENARLGLWPARR